MLKLGKEIETVHRDYPFLDQRNLIVHIHELHVTIDQAKTLKVIRMSF